MERRARCGMWAATGRGVRARRMGGRVRRAQVAARRGLCLWETYRMVALISKKCSLNVLLTDKGPVTI